MKKYKLVDFIIGNTLIVLFLLVNLTGNNTDFLLSAYLIVGGWQVLSMFIHLFSSHLYIRTHLRKVYEMIIIFLLFGGLLCFLLGYLTEGGSIFIFLYLLLFGSPLLAIYYQVVCYYEYRLLLKKELIHLKN